MRPDLLIQITFEIATEHTTIQTNAPHERVGELLEEYLRSIMGAGGDTTPFDQRERYVIKLGIDLGDETWQTMHDCGNQGLRDGIIRRVYTLLTAITPSGITFVD